MLYLNKFLSQIKKTPTLFKNNDIIFRLGINSSNIKKLKNFALKEGYIQQEKTGYFLTLKGEEYLQNNPLKSWASKEFNLRDEINIEYLKENKAPAVLTKAIRAYAKNLLENQELKEFSLEYALSEDVKKCNKLYTSLEAKMLDGKRNSLEEIFNFYINKGLTKSIVAVNLLKILSENLDKIAIYEKSQFQLKFDTLMFDRMFACPQNFEIQKTVMHDIYILKDISKIILNTKSENILEITKGLYAIIKKLDKYTMNTQNLDTKTLRLRNVILNAKDPISLFEKDIPKVLLAKTLKECDREFLDILKNSLDELKNCTINLVEDLKSFILESFHAKSRQDLALRFLEVKNYINNDDLKILFNSVTEIDINDELWTNRIATFINKQRVPKDWSDNDYADFKIKTKELALKFFILESVVGLNESFATKSYHSVLSKYLKLSRPEQVLLLKNIVNF